MYRNYFRSLPHHFPSCFPGVNVTGLDFPPNVENRVGQVLFEGGGGGEPREDLDIGITSWCVCACVCVCVCVRY